MWTQTTTNDKLDIQEDTIVQSVIEQYFQRSQLGIKKYNTTLDRNDLSLHEWLEHLKQELMDIAIGLDVFFVYTSTELLSYSQLESSMLKAIQILLEKINKSQHQNTDN